MRILLEEHSYQCTDELKSVLDTIGLDLPNDKDQVSINYVGYFYNTKLNDCVFILPKVLMNEKDRVFASSPTADDGFTPESLLNISIENGAIVDTDKQFTKNQRSFLYEFCIWIYRAILVFKSNNPTSNIVVAKASTDLSASNRNLQEKTYLDVIIALIDFYRFNKNFFIQVLKTIHSCYNKINWPRTVAKSQAFVQDDDEVAYLKLYNKKRFINFDEELFIIYFSILNYVSEQYGFPISVPTQFELIKGKKFEHYLNDFGARRLLQIKYKYFSDKALKLWNLCYFFFNKEILASKSSDKKEYLIAKNFNIVFESIIDDLIGDKRDAFPEDLKDQTDGKRVDHLYTHDALIWSNNAENNVYYIGDSKYYKIGNAIGDESVYKQYTYAKNVIQYSMDAFFAGDNSYIQLQDPLTEGYNVIPNFFISADVNQDLSYIERVEKANRVEKIKSKDGDNKGIEVKKEHPVYMSKQFENRLFDRDTLLIQRYNVNFLHIISLYARNNQITIHDWKTRARDLFKKNIQDDLKKLYLIYALTPKFNIDCKSYIKAKFKDLVGKIFAPFTDRDYYLLALDSPQQDPLSTDVDYDRQLQGEDNLDLFKRIKSVFNVDLVDISVAQKPKDSELNNIYQGCHKAVDAEHLDVLVVNNVLSESHICDPLFVECDFTLDNAQLFSRLHNVGFLMVKIADNKWHISTAQNVELSETNKDGKSNDGKVYLKIQNDLPKYKRELQYALDSEHVDKDICILGIEEICNKLINSEIKSKKSRYTV